MSIMVPSNNPINLSGLGSVNSSQQSERANQRSGNFSTNLMPLGDNENGILLLGLVIVLVQLLLQQFGSGQQQEQEQQDGQQIDQEQQGTQQTGQSQEQQNNNTQDLTDDFTDMDKDLLLNTIGRGEGSGTTINRIQDRNASGNLNGGDNLELETNAQLEDHAFTDDESRNFIEARNPPSTAKLPLSSQQTMLLENRYSMEDVSIADNNGDQQISVGDFLTGFQMQGGRKIQLDIPVDQALIALLNP